MEALTQYDIKELERRKNDFIKHAPHLSEDLNAILGVFTDNLGMITGFGVRFYQTGEVPQLKEKISYNLFFSPYENLSQSLIKSEV
ncbi:MAG: hypothetical protein KDC52_10625 [Ignavibacteriae bacterium]|nr:hypothetical protein [Ignavibacteriota bacterium]MCB0746260.1 hypothetical protein [Ignavibacteriota bacterium]MCB0751919.1 hypothetical protein [Ignavibacteriota bacterium]